ICEGATGQITATSIARPLPNLHKGSDTSPGRRLVTSPGVNKPSFSISGFRSDVGQFEHPISHRLCLAIISPVFLHQKVCTKKAGKVRGKKKKKEKKVCVCVVCVYVWCVVCLRHN